MPRKIELNIQYIKDISIVTDIKLIFKAIFKIIVKKRGIEYEENTFYCNSSENAYYGIPYPIS